MTIKIVVSVIEIWQVWKMSVLNEMHRTKTHRLRVWVPMGSKVNVVKFIEAVTILCYMYMQCTLCAFNSVHFILSFVLLLLVM